MSFFDEAKKYIAYMTFTSAELYLEFKQSNYPNAKYAVVYYQHPDATYHKNMSFILIHNISMKSGKLIVFTGYDALNYIIADVSGDLTNLTARYEFNFDNFPNLDDLLEDTECYNHFKYIKLIEADDERAHNELTGCLIDLFVDFKLSSMKAQLAAFETRLKALENK